MGGTRPDRLQREYFPDGSTPRTGAIPEMTFRLGIVVAMAREARMLQILHAPGGQVAVQVSGIGRARARATALKLLAEGTQALVSWGTAVALEPGLRPGQLLLPEQLLHPESGAIAVSGGWHHRLCRRLASQFSICDRPMVTTDRWLLSPSDKRRVGMETGAASADMESAELAAVAHQANVPFIVLRSIADSVETPVPHWLTDIIDPAGQVRLPGAIPAAIGHPKDWASLFRLARDFNAALGTLRQVAEGDLYARLQADAQTTNKTMELSQNA